MKYYLNYLKEYRTEIKNIKLVLLIVVNIWLFIIFWKILIISDASIINNNLILNKATLLLQPILSVLGIDILTPNMLKMIILCFIVVFTNLLILYFNQMASIIVLTILVRYSYKSYTNYLKNQENLDYLGFETKKELVEQIPQLIIQQTSQIVESSTNWWQWGAIGCVCLIAIGGIIFMVWSHNQSANNLIDANQINERVTRLSQQFDFNDAHYSTMYSNIDKKILDLENKVQKVSANLVDVNKIDNSNVLKFSQESLILPKKASEAISDISESSSTVEATTVGLAHIWEFVKGFSTRIETLEVKTNIVTPNLKDKKDDI